jgi:hypothetical protein
VPVIATEGVTAVIRRDDAVKEQILPGDRKGDGGRRMTGFLPTDELQFLMVLSVEPVATKLGLVPP